MDLNPNPSIRRGRLANSRARSFGFTAWDVGKDPNRREPSHTPQPSLVATCELCGFLLDLRTERGFAMRIANQGRLGGLPQQTFVPQPPLDSLRGILW